MQIIQNHNDNRPDPASLQENRNLFLGILLIAAGGLWLLKNFGMLSPRAFDMIFSWPSLVTVIGAYLLCLHQWIWGGILAGVGICLLIAQIVGMPMPVIWLLLPLLCIGIGMAILLRTNA